MLTELRPAILITLVFTLLTGILYPLAVTGIAPIGFSAPGQRKPGTGRRDNGRVEPDCAEFYQAGVFSPRPSAAGDKAMIRPRPVL